MRINAVSVPADKVVTADWVNPTLPAHRTDIRTMPESAWREYRAGIVRILMNAGESDTIRQRALTMLLEADRRLWANKIANIGNPNAN